MIDRKNFRQQLFAPGRVVATRGAMALGADFTELLDRHVCGDWGDCDCEDWEHNNRALREGTRLLSVYRLQGQRIYVITEWDRSLTTILLAEEY